jgi:hypothetical protein
VNGEKMKTEWVHIFEGKKESIEPGKRSQSGEARRGTRGIEGRL